MKNNIHSTAQIGEGAKLGDGVSVGPYSVIQDGATIGGGTIIGSHVFISGYTTLGEKCKVHAGAVIGDDPQDLTFAGGDSFVRVGDRCTMREGVTIHRGTKPGSETIVGDDCFLMAYSHLAHNVILGKKVILANSALLAGYVSIGDGAFLSGNVSVHQFVRIGRLVMIGANAIATKDVPPFCTVVPATLNDVGGLNVIGMRRAGMAPDTRARIRAAFKLLYREGLNVKQAVERIRAQVTGPEVEEFVEFIAASKRGVCPAFRNGHLDVED